MMANEYLYELVGHSISVDLFAGLNNNPFAQSVHYHHHITASGRWSFSIKSIEISRHLRSGMGSGFRRTCLRSLHTTFARHLSQFRVNLRMSCAMPGQYTLRARMAYVILCPGWPQSMESWVSCIRRVRKGSEFGTQRRSR